MIHPKARAVNGAAVHASELRMILLPPQRTSVCLKCTSKHNYNLSWCNYRDFPRMIYITLPKDANLHAHLWCEVSVAVNVYNYIKSCAGFSANCVTALGCRDPASPLTFSGEQISWLGTFPHGWDAHGDISVSLLKGDVVPSQCFL